MRPRGKNSGRRILKTAAGEGKAEEQIAADCYIIVDTRQLVVYNAISYN